jgi:hypothetical protein
MCGIVMFSAQGSAIIGGFTVGNFMYRFRKFAAMLIHFTAFNYGRF